MNRPGRVALALALIALCYAGFQARRSGLVGTFFHLGSAHTAAPRLAAPAVPPEPAGLTPAARVRVVLIDGVGHAAAADMPAYRDLCARGVELTVDTGFPTVSLPVQHVLWTGLTQQQAGVQFIGAPGLETPPPAGIPVRVPGSVAVAESHQFIVHAFGFERALPALGDGKTVPDSWKQAEFLATAEQEVAGASPLVFVHVLRTDVAGHRHGGASPAFAQAMADADAMLARLVAAAPEDDVRWFLLADHGHLPAGGHGGEDMRHVRGCIAGAGVPAGQTGGYVHLVDLARSLADSLGLTLDARAVGRPLWAALAAPVERDATLPAPLPLWWLVAALVLLAGLAATASSARGVWWQLPWWWPVAFAALLVVHGSPTMSMPLVYKPLGRDIYMAALPGLAVLALSAGLAARRTEAWRVLVAQLAVPAALALGAFFLAGGASGAPPLMPRWTALTSVFAVLFTAGAGVVALALLASCVPLGSDRGGPRESRRRSP